MVHKANSMLWKWAMRWEGWERLGNWHSLQLMSTLCRKIRSIWCYKPKYEHPPSSQTMWELICLGQGGPPTGWPGGQNHNSWGKNSFRASLPLPLLNLTLTPKTAELRDGPVGLARQTLGGIILAIGPAASWPRGHIPDIPPSDGSILVSSQRTDVLLTTCVAEWGDLWSHCSSSTADSLWFDPQVNHHELLPCSPFFRSPEVYFDSHLLSEGSCRRSNPKFYKATKDRVHNKCYICSWCK